MLSTAALDRLTRFDALRTGRDLMDESGPVDF